MGVSAVAVKTDCSTQPSILFQRTCTQVTVPIFLISGMTWTMRPVTDGVKHTLRLPVQYAVWLLHMLMQLITA